MHQNLVEAIDERMAYELSRTWSSPFLLMKRNLAVASDMPMVFVAMSQVTILRP